ncbi:acyltransferase [Algimonas arctica]|uniref:Acyltransferase n=2 Tax=Algimonas arctica TaxID=1479486 RepID=A0A8J3CPP5_9PROT|nr:acyltransferase [Algimonas arctica]
MLKQSTPVKIRDGHDNFFTPLRLIFALLVMVGHAFAVQAGNGDSEPHVFLHYTFSYLAVNMFFIASGLLVTKSILYRGDVPAFLAARSLRIMPALVVHMLFVALVVGTFMTTLPLLDYLTHKDVWMQPFKVLTFYDTDMILPGVFTANGEQYGSAPLWTLRYEVLCYIATFLAFSLGFLRRKWMVLAQFVIPSLVWIAGQNFGLFESLPATTESATRFGIAYGLGAMIYAYRDVIRVHWIAIPALAALSWILRDTPMVEVTANLMLACFVIWVAYVKAPKFAWMQRVTDLSYGIYIYHWVVMQVIIGLLPNATVLSLFMFSLPVVVGLAWLSWTFVEKPMLAYKKPFGAWLRFGRSQPSFDKTAVLLD